MDEIYQKLIHSDGISSIRWYVDGKLSDIRNHDELLISSREAQNKWKNNPCRGLILTKVSEKLAAQENKFLKLASFIRYQREDLLKIDLKYSSLGFRYYSKMSNRRILKSKDSSDSGIFGGVILDRCPVLVVLTWLTAASLAAGNSVVLLINPFYSIFALYFAAVLHEAGVPPGVLNVVPFVNQESFITVSRYFSRISGIVPEIPNTFIAAPVSTVYSKKHSLCPMLILKSADVDSAVDCLINLAQTNEALWFPNVIYVEEIVYSKFLQSLKNVVVRHNLGKSDDGELDAALTVFLNEKRGQGYEILELKNESSICLVMVNCDHAVKIPVLITGKATIHHLVSLLPVRTVREGISAVNDNETDGVAVSFWSNNANNVLSVPSTLKYGTVWVNCIALYSPSVPFSPRLSFGYGTFSGKRAFYEKIIKFPLPLNFEYDRSFQADKKIISSSTQVSSMIKKCLEAQFSWWKLELIVRLNYLENIAVAIEKEWKTNRDRSAELTNGTENVWEKAIRYTNFWSCYGLDCTYHEIVKTDHCRVLCESQPLGIIGIIAGKAPLDEIVFSISAALVYGNGVIVGLSTDKKSTAKSADIEKIFSSKTDLVNVISSDTESLWQQFLSEKNVAAVWYMKAYCNLFSKTHSLKNIIPVESEKDMIQLTEFFEIYGTKQQAVWLPDVLV